MFVNCTCKLYANNGVKLSHGEISSNYLQVMTKSPAWGFQIDAALFLLEPRIESLLVNPGKFPKTRWSLRHPKIRQ